MGDEGEDQRWMRLAIELAWLCPPSETAYSVGAVIVGADGTEVSRGYSREGGDPAVHAEESALGKLADGDPRLAGATIYSTLEPCSQRQSRPCTCTQLIIASGIRRVVIAWREPNLFVADCQGVELLTQAGLEVTELPSFAARAAAPNRHLKVTLWDISHVPTIVPRHLLLTGRLGNHRATGGKPRSRSLRRR